MGKPCKYIWLCICCVLSMPALSQEAAAPISYSVPQAVYEQNFNGLPNTGSFSLSGKGPLNISSSPINTSSLAGWQIWMKSGSNTNTGFAISTGSSTGSNVYSLGSSGAVDRALGTLASGTGIYSFGLIFTNNTGHDLNRCTISFTMEQWRKGGSGNINTWSFRYKTGIIDRIDALETTTLAELDMKSLISTSSAATLNGNLADNQKTVSFTIQNIVWKKGEQLLLRWDDADETGSDDAMAIDNFSFSAEQFITHPSANTLTASAITPNSAILHGVLNTGFGNTAAWFEYDTTADFLHADTIHIIDSIPANISDTVISVNLNNLQTGSTYYYRIVAANATGIATGNAMSFITSRSIPSVTTKAASDIRTSSAVLGGNIISTGGTNITEKGIVWSLSGSPSTTDYKIISDTIAHDYRQLITDLPQATTIYARAYAINIAGTAYGNTISFTTATVVLSLTNVSAPLTNAASVQFNMRIAQPVTGLSASNFSLTTNGISNAMITAINGSANNFTITVNTGNSNGKLSIQLVNDTNVSIPIENIPFESGTGYIIDKSPPQIRAVSIPDSSMKYGDTVDVTIIVQPDTDAYLLSSLKIAGLTGTQFRKINDSIYKAVMIIKNSTDISSSSDIPVYLVLKDAAGNSNSAYTNPITQTSDLIDVTRPTLTSVQLPESKTYKTGDTLNFVFRFSEPISLNNIAENSTVSITIGSRAKACSYVSGDGSDSLHYRYIIVINESDKDGIRFSVPLTFRNTSITDMAGNEASISYSFPSSAKIIVDAVLPKINSVSTPPAAIYKTGNLLDFTIHFSKKIWVDTALEIPSIQVLIGNNTRNAYYSSGEGGTALLFRYKITDDDMDKDGIKLSPYIQLSNAHIFDEAGNHALLQLNSIGTLSGIIINPPVIAITGISLPPDSLYGVSAKLVFVAEYNENAFVDTTNGTPSIRFTAGSSYKYAVYRSGSGSRNLLFDYITQPGDLDTNGILVSSTILYNNGTIRDERGNAAPPGLTGIGNTTGVQIDAVQPEIKSVSTPAKNIYGKSDTLDFTVSFSEKMFSRNVADSLFMYLNIGAQKKKAVYQSGIGTSSLLFRYIVTLGDNDMDGIKLDSVIANAATILSDKAGNSVIPILKNIGALSGIKITTPLPAFISNNTQLTICANQTISIESVLQSKYTGTGEQLQWQISNPVHGSVSIQYATVLSNGGIISPGSITYTPDKNYAGNDSLLAIFTDGINLVQKTVSFIIHPPVTSNSITASQNICISNTPALLRGSVPSGGTDNYTYNWEAAANSDSLTFSKAGSAIGKQDYQPGKLNIHTWFRRKVQSGACESISEPVLISVFKTGFWTGGFDSLWNNPNNWCMQSVPDDKTDVVIDDKTLFSPYITESAACNNLLLFGDARISVKGKLDTYGKISSPPGKIDASAGTVAYSGSVPQLLSAQSFRNNRVENLVINNPAGVSANTHLLITGKLLLNSGAFSTNDKIKLTASAMVAPSAANTSIKGNLIIEHFIPGGRSAFRLIGHPFTKPILPDMIKDSIDITGENGAANGFTSSPHNQPSAFLFNPGITNDSIGFEAGWRPLSHTSESWKENAGMRLLVRGRPGQGLNGLPAGDGTNGTYYPDDVRLLFSGPVHTGNHELILSKNIRPSYHVISNPYPCPIDLSRITHGNGIAPHYWLWDPWQGNNGGYTSIRSSDSYILPAFGAFIVRVNENIENQLQFTENSKAVTSQTTKPEGNFIELSLESGKISWDKLTIFANDNARIYVDENDAEKFNNSEVNFYSISRDKKALSIDTRPVDNASVIPLGLQTKQQQSFSIRIADMRMPSGNTLQLHDRYLGKWMPLIKDSAYAFHTTDDTSSYGEQRFEISSYRKTMIDTATVFKLNTNISPIPAHDKLSIRFSAPVSGNTFIRLLSQNGNMLKQMSLGTQKSGEVLMQIAGIPSGIYLLEIKCGEYSSIQRIIKQ